MLPRSLDRAFDFRPRRTVGTHRVQRYDACHGVFRLAGFLDIKYFASLVVPTLGACPMRQLALVAIGTFGKRTAG